MSIGEDLHRLVDELPQSEKYAAQRLLEYLVDKAWFDSDLGGPLPPFDWGPDGPPPVRPVRFDPDKGLVVEDGK
ncbi:MAG TPA: hypothetical protein VMW83_09775 [Spirochaetia bacterium]|nr:hypothetical protein [Spirochaetia bacterium]